MRMAIGKCDGLMASIRLVNENGYYRAEAAAAEDDNDGGRSFLMHR